MSILKEPARQEQQQILTDNDSDDFLTSPNPFAPRPKIRRDEFDASTATVATAVGNTSSTGSTQNNKSLSKSLVRKTLRDAEKSIFQEVEDKGGRKTFNNKSINKKSPSVANDILLESDDGDSNDVSFANDCENVRSGGDQSRDDFTTPKGTLYMLSLGWKKL